MRRFCLATLAAAALATTAAAPAPDALPGGYLSGATAPDTLRILPPAPAPGDARDRADVALYRQSRALGGSPRWALAQKDISEATILKDMSCAVGVELTPANAPGLSALLRRARIDVRNAVNRPKDTFARRRPYVANDGPICADKTPSLAVSPDYPSGHATWGWSVGLMLAELAPDRATEVLVRARAFGESRLVCGVHTLSAVEAGRTNASVVVAALHGDAQFRSDLEAARGEVAAARRAGPAADPAACAAEGALTEKSPF